MPLRAVFIDLGSIVLPGAAQSVVGRRRQRMTEAEWHRSDDAGAMLDFLWQQQGISPHWTDLRFGGDVREAATSGGTGIDLECALHQFYLASCRAIWKLLPQEESRRGVEMAEQYLDG